MAVVGRSHRRGRQLELTGPEGRLAEVRVGKDAKPDHAAIDAPDGTWRLAEPVSSGKGRESVRETAVLDAGGTQVATIRAARGEVRIELAGGESFPYRSSGHFFMRRYRLGDDLFVARSDWRPGREFSAELSPTLSSRADRTLLVALAGLLTHRRIQDAKAAAAASSG